MGFFGASHEWGGKNNVAQVTQIMLYMQYCDQKNIFAKGYVQNWPENVFLIKSVKNTVTRTYLKNDLDSEEIVASFYEKELNGKLKIVYSHQEKRCLNYMLIGKAILILLTVGLIKKRYFNFCFGCLIWHSYRNYPVLQQD